MAIAADRTVPALIVKIGGYLPHHGSVGAIRTLGRLGVPVYAVAGRFTPAAASRYLTGRISWPTTGTEPADELVEALRKVAARLPGPAVAVPTDDEAAILLAEHADALSEHLLLPPVPRELPRRLASKSGLAELCRAHDVPVPESMLVTSPAEAEDVAARFRFPVVAKNSDAWVRIAAPAVLSTTVVRTPQELRARAAGWPLGAHVLVQEYLPREESTDWIAHVCCDRRGEVVVAFTGVKVRSWPAHAGVTAYAYTEANPELAALTTRFCTEIGYAGVADLDWRFDHRDGRYKLLDFNPRVGAQFRLFETDGGIDVVRALHLTLTGRPFALGRPVEGRRMVVENVDLPARLAYRRERATVRSAAGRPTAPRFPSPAQRPLIAPVPDESGSSRPSAEERDGPPTPRPPSEDGGLELAWLAADDPLPAVVTALHSSRPVMRRVRRLFRRA